MDLEKKEDDRISFNLSPSSLNLYYQSPLLFYLTYIAKVPDDTSVPLCYGLSGNIVHECLEKYAKRNLDKDSVCLYFSEKWKKHNLHVHKDLKGRPLNHIEYLTALLKGMYIIDQHENPLCEETIALPLIENELMKIGIKGIVDLQATKKETGQFVVIDYKTNNSVERGGKFERQALFYNLLLHAKKNILPSQTSFHYLKLGVSKDYSFTLEDIYAFKEELEALAQKLLSFGTEITKYSVGEIEDVFNSKKQACLKEIARRKLLEDPTLLLPTY